MEAGSSPLTRGKRRLRGRRICRVGLIPAHAGKTSCGRSTARAGTAHPRSRGENSRCKRRRCWSAGSSPLTRGKPGTSPTYQRPPRLIPAHAGKTHATCHRRHPPTAHPRSRGENGIFVFSVIFLVGSSPLTRGKRLSSQRTSTAARLIPAHAGKTTGRAWRCAGSWAHPRSRGENRRAGQITHGRVGSSPLTRGKLTVPRGKQSEIRLIPAHAGKTCHQTPSDGAGQAHPRSRGENKGEFKFRDEFEGSSPLTRGKLLSIIMAALTPRLIPAHAGKTTKDGPNYIAGRAHPRSRGENCRASWSTSSRRGSSPLTRGKRSNARYPSTHNGLIPAHAGKTVSPFTK